MNFIEAVGDWKSNDEWRYADKEAAWKFFFAAGKESSQTVISAQCVKMSQYESIIFELRRQLAAAQEECEFQRNAHKQAEELMLEQSNQLAAAQEQLAKAKVRLEASERLLNEAHNALVWYYEMQADSYISQLLEKLEKHLNPL